VIGFSHPQYPISAIQELMKQKKWSLSLIQKPIALHFSFTPLNSKRVDQMIQDFEKTMQELEKLKAEGNLPKDNPEL
jgi:acyl CoA:acetate/3-ketoacid CoA transferase alpha subunit